MVFLVYHYNRVGGGEPGGGGGGGVLLNYIATWGFWERDFVTQTACAEVGTRVIGRA